MQEKKHNLVLTVQLCVNKLEREWCPFFSPFLSGPLAVFMAHQMWNILNSVDVQRIVNDVFHNNNNDNMCKNNA